MEDAQIVDLYWQRSEDAIARTAEKYGRYCHTVAYNVLGSDADAEECVNDTYLAAWNSMPDNRPTRLGAYLGRIARNFALTRWQERRAQKRGGGEAAAVWEELADCLTSPDTPEGQAEARELSEGVSRFLRSLPETERAVFLGRYWYFLPVDVLAERFGFSRSKTAGMLHRTRKKLRRALEREELL